MGRDVLGNCLLGLMAVMLLGCSAEGLKTATQRSTSCFDQLLGNELDDIEVYSTENCDPQGELKPYLLLIRPKDADTFHVSIRFVVTTRDTALRGSLRYSIKGVRRVSTPVIWHKIEKGCQKSYCDEVRYFEIWLPWKHLEAAEGGIEIRYMGDFIKKGVVTDPMVRGIRKIINGKKWEEAPPEIDFLESDRKV